MKRGEESGGERMKGEKKVNIDEKKRGKRELGEKRVIGGRRERRLEGENKRNQGM